MRKNGNTKQWTGGYPTEEIIKKDIENGNSYVCLDEEQKIVGTFAFIQGDDPTYAHIYDGAWIDDKQPYGVIHPAIYPQKIRLPILRHHLPAKWR